MTTTAKASSNYYRQIRLGPAIGDWTTYRADDDQSPLRTADELPVAFDSLPASQLKLALKLHYHLADKLTHQLSHGLDIKVELHSVDVLQIPYNSFVAGLTDRLIQSRWQVGRWGWFHMLMDWSFASVVIDRLVGGKGQESSTPSAEFSDLELDILDTQMTEFVAPYTSTWSPLIEPHDIGLCFAHGSLKKDNRYSGRAATIVFGFDFDFGEAGHHRISLAYPNVTLKNLLTAYEKTHQAVEQRVFFKPDTLSNIQVPVKSVLGKTKLTMAEVSALQVGDVIPLNIALGSPVEISVDDVLTMRGVPGIRQNQVAIQITDNPELHQKLRSIVVRERQEPAIPQSKYMPSTASRSESFKTDTTQLSFLTAAGAVDALAPAAIEANAVFEPESEPDVPTPEAIVEESDPFESESDFVEETADGELEHELDHDDDAHEDATHEDELSAHEDEPDEQDDLLEEPEDAHEEEHDEAHEDEHDEAHEAEEDDDDFSWDDLDDDDTEK